MHKKWCPYQFNKARGNKQRKALWVGVQNLYKLALKTFDAQRGVKLALIGKCWSNLTALNKIGGFSGGKAQI